MEILDFIFFLSHSRSAYVNINTRLETVCDSLSEFSDENMMDPYNLAICFGPTLLPVPADHDQVQYQSHVIEIVRNVIAHQDEIFSQLDPTPDNSTLYERCLVENHR